VGSGARRSIPDPVTNRLIALSDNQCAFPGCMNAVTGQVAPGGAACDSRSVDVLAKYKAEHEAKMAPRNRRRPRAVPDPVNPQRTTALPTRYPTPGYSDRRHEGGRRVYAFFV
jgi:hypothetical protein